MADRFDLTECDREPIRIPGAIQPHGVLLCLQGADNRVVQYSANLPAELGRAGEDLAGQPLEALFGPSLARDLERALGADVVSEMPYLLGNYPLGVDTGSVPRHVDAVVHRTKAALILELEPSAYGTSEHFSSIYPLVRLFVSRLQETDSVKELCQLAAVEMRRITGFDRTLVYRFDAEGHGEVLGEDRDEALMSHLGQWFPATDIPRQARELYVLNRIRMIPTASYEPVPLVPPHLPGQTEPTDLSQAMLRM